jgi:hypothetical protein
MTKKEVHETTNDIISLSKRLSRQVSDTDPTFSKVINPLQGGKISCYELLDYLVAVLLFKLGKSKMVQVYAKLGFVL